MTVTKPVDDRSVDLNTQTAPWQLRTMGIVLSIAGFISLGATFALMLEKLAYLSDPDYLPICTVSEKLQCLNVMNSPQAEAFGFPNPMIGLIAFPVVITIGVSLLGKAQFPEWFWLGFEVGLIAAVIFIHWLMYQSLFVIGSLCIWCMIVWVFTMMIFSFVTSRNLYRYADALGPLRSVADFCAKMSLPLLILWYVIVAIIVVFFIVGLI